MFLPLSVSVGEVQGGDDECDEQEDYRQAGQQHSQPVNWKYFHQMFCKIICGSIHQKYLTGPLMKIAAAVSNSSLQCVFLQIRTKL